MLCILPQIWVHRRTWQDDTGWGWWSGERPLQPPQNDGLQLPARLGTPGLGSQGSCASTHSGNRSPQRPLGLSSEDGATVGASENVSAPPAGCGGSCPVRCGPGWRLTLSLQVQRRGQAPPGHGAEASARACRCGHRPAGQTSWGSPNFVPASPTHSPITAPHSSFLSSL